MSNPKESKSGGNANERSKVREEIAKNKYVPEYAEGEILVCFKDLRLTTPKKSVSMSLTQGFDGYLGTLLGYEVSEERLDFYDSVIVYKVPKGKETEACAKFKKYSEFVDWAERRDVKAERRYDGLDDVIRKMENLRDDCDTQSDEMFKSKLKEISNYMNKLK
jgi:hypothetical protein